LYDIVRDLTNYHTRDQPGGGTVCSIRRATGNRPYVVSRLHVGTSWQTTWLENTIHRVPILDQVTTKAQTRWRSRYVWWWKTARSGPSRWAAI